RTVEPARPSTERQLGPKEAENKLGPASVGLAAEDLAESRTLPLEAALQGEGTAETKTSGPATEEPADTGSTFPAVPGYEILGVLGRGGMGVVYKARQAKLNRIVALKMLLAGQHAGKKERARFDREAAIVARFQHPHLVQIYEKGE